MKKTFILIGIILFCYSCKTSKVFNIDNEISLLSKKDTIKELNLSKKKLHALPDLSQYLILKLNLSDNSIVSFDESFLPKSLEDLNLENNKIKEYVKISEASKLKKLNLNNNKIEKFYTDRCISKLNLSNNNLTLVQMPLYEAKHIRLDSLDISNNHKLSNYLGFHPEIYSHINRENILNKEPLKSFIEIPLH